MNGAKEIYVYEKKKEDRKPRTLTDIDFLLGVYDETRMGALRLEVPDQKLPYLHRMARCGLRSSRQRMMKIT